MRAHIHCPADWYWYIKPRLSDRAYDQDPLRAEGRLGFTVVL